MFEISRVDFARVRCPFRAGSLPTYNLLPVSFVSFRRFLYLLAISLMSTVARLQKLQAQNASLYSTHSEIRISYDSQHKSPLGERKGNGEDGYYEKMTYRLVLSKPFVKTHRWFRAKNRRNCSRLSAIVLKGNRSFATKLP